MRVTDEKKIIYLKIGSVLRTCVRKFIFVNAPAQRPSASRHRYNMQSDIFFSLDNFMYLGAQTTDFHICSILQRAKQQYQTDQPTDEIASFQRLHFTNVQRIKPKRGKKNRYIHMHIGDTRSGCAAMVQT